MTPTPLTTSTIAAPALPPRRWALTLIGALLWVVLGTLTTSTSPPIAASPDAQELTIGGIASIEQTFSMRQAGMSGVAIRVRPGSGDDTTLRLPIRLRYADGPPIDLVGLGMPLSAAEDGWLQFRFPAPIVPRAPHAISETLRLIIDVPQLPPNTGPLITALPNATAQGQLLIDGRAAPGLDLAVTPLYQQRWVDRIWPISAMAAGKPGLLGWPPLYLLGPYLYFVVLAEGARALRRAVNPVG